MSKNVLVIAAHPDDEILGCGGTMAKLAQQGHNVFVVIAAEGIMSRSVSGQQMKEMEHLHQVCKSANLALGVKEVEFLRFPDNRMDSVDFLDVTKMLEYCAARYKPNIIFSHHINDLNIDHRICHLATLTAGRPLPGSDVEQIYFYEVPSASDWIFSGSSRVGFVPNHFVDIHEQLQLKLDALAKYETEMRPFPHARSIKACEHLARWRGAMVGVEAAEAFEVGRTLYR